MLKSCHIYNLDIILEENELNIYNNTHLTLFLYSYTYI